MFILAILVLAEMDTFMIFLACVAVVLLILLLYLIRSGVFHSIVIETLQDSPYPASTFCYKFKTGDYRNCGSVFGEACVVAPNRKCMGIYYDDPRNVSSLPSI